MKLWYLLQCSSDARGWKNYALASLGITVQLLAWPGRIFTTRKHRQSYSHADPRRQRPQITQRHMAAYRYTECWWWSQPTMRLTIFVPCDLDLWPLGQCMPSDCYRVIRVPSLVLTAQAFFLLEHRQTDTTEHHTHAGGYAGVGNYCWAIWWLLETHW